MPGSRAATVSGSALRTHSRQSHADDSKEAMMLRKFGSLSSSVMWSQLVCQHAVMRGGSIRGFVMRLNQG